MVLAETATTLTPLEDQGLRRMPDREDHELVAVERALCPGPRR